MIQFPTSSTQLPSRLLPNFIATPSLSRLRPRIHSHSSICRRRLLCCVDNRHIRSKRIRPHPSLLNTMEEYKKKANTGDDVLVKVLPATGAPRPTAVLFGWLGAKHRTVSKYGDVYLAMGYNTVQMVAPFSTVFAVHPRASARFLLSALRILAADERLHAGGIVFQFFSNGGAVCAPHLAQMLAGSCSVVVQADDVLVVRKIKASIAGVVFDSSPVYMRLSIGARSINEGFGVPKGPLSFLLWFFFSFLCLIQMIFVINLPKWFWTSLHQAEYGVPELYIYSTADKLMDAPMLDELVEYRSKIRTVRCLRVEDAAHVMILRKHPDKYLEQIKGVNEWGVQAWRRKNNMPRFNFEPS